MRVLWTLFKIGIAAAILIPLAIIVLSTALGVLGALVGLAFFAIRIGIIGLLCYGAIRLAMALLGGGSKPKPASRPAELPLKVDPYLEAARKELDREIPDPR